ncbi:MAG: transporter [Phycisphaerae bacterium]|nr:transporter [Phycisphaerae bacterium]
MKKLLILTLICLVSVAGKVQAETDLLEAAAPPGYHFQYFNIYQHGQDFARDDIGLKDLDIDVNVSLFRPVKWWDNGVIHAVIPYGYIDQEATVSTPGGPMQLVGDSKWDLGDAFIGGAYRWHSEKANDMKDPGNKWWVLAGSDFRFPTGNYDSKCDPYDAKKLVPDSGVNFGNGSFSVQPFFILSTLFNKGMFGTDTEVRWDFNTSAGPIKYNPDDKLELWQTFHMGLPGGFRVGVAAKGEFEITDDDNDDDHSLYIGVGPELMWMKGNFVIWTKVLFDVMTNDSPEEFITAYVRMGWNF